MNHHYTNRNNLKLRNKQQGLTLILVTFMMIVMLFFSALAIDYNHAISNKTQLQNVVDAAALAGASEINQALINEEASIDQNEVEQAINTRLSKMVEPDNSTVLIEYLTSPTEEVGRSSSPSITQTYVRVAVSDVNLESYFTQIFGVGKQVSASALAGPAVKVVNQVCNDIMPIGVCDLRSAGDTSSDFGYTGGSNYEVKSKKFSGNDDAIGPGNFGFLAFDGRGASNLGDNLRDDYEGCLTIGQPEDVTVCDVNTEGEEVGCTVTTEPGNKNSVNDDYNSRFGDDSTINSYEDYLAALNNCDTDACKASLVAEYKQRIAALPVLDCQVSGRKSVDVVGLGCFFLTEKIQGNGTDAIITMEYIDDCTAGLGDYGELGGETTIVTEDKVQLYKDPLSGES
ncbi:pilus assembly protein TadG-related protein [Vibrio sp. CK2-1]|uniref:TadE/TadG family type IV pilus assembly protein n=1 Tax=Vibrio sp. CK2-1 TaxID=2912249 RepID=UPI001F1D98BB|nr:pilus assembly protein TadG-related protein [Vibrio sp. CK2-1]MCF7354024.1 Tad domain-containing protein [Vibrio sp. CK2-1]